MTLKKMTRAEFLKETGREDMEHLKEPFSAYPDATAVVVFRNNLMDSSSFGETSTVLVGPSNTFTSPEACEGKWLHDFPSRRQHPIGWVPREELVDE